MASRKGDTQAPIQERLARRTVIMSSGCHEWTGATRRGYGTIIHRGVMIGTHRVAWEIENGPVPDGMLICHRCDNRRCIRSDHLFLGTNQDNMADMVAKGRSNRGEIHGNAKLTEAQVRAIRCDYATGVVTQRHLANLYGISQMTISDIVTGQLWKHIDS